MKNITFSAVMANSIKNLLQGYTKGIRFVAVLTVLLTMGFGQAWGASYPLTVNYPYVYLDNSILGWDGCNVVVGHDSYSYGYLMTLIPNTQLFYKEIPANWGDAKGIVFVEGTSQWGEWKDKSLWDRTNTENRTGYQWDNQYESMDYHNTYLCTSTGSNDLIISYQSSGYSDLNSQQTIQSAVNGAVADSKATISITSYEMTGNGIATKQTATLGTGANVSYITAARTATTTLTVGDVEAGYQFDGWYTAATGGTLLSSSTTYTYYPTAATTVYARFSAKTYTVTLDNQGATTGDASVTVTYGSIMPDITKPKKTGYKFGGYFTERNGSGIQYYNQEGKAYRGQIWKGTEPITLYAKWTAHEYKVIFKPNGGSGTMEEQSFTYDVEQALTKNEFTRDGYTFAGWNENESGNSTSYADQQKVKNLTPTEDGQKTLYAQWRPSESYTVTWNPNGGNWEGSADNKEDAYNVDEAIIPPVDPTRKGYRFIGWGADILSTMPNYNLTYTAQWECIAPTNLNITGAYVHFPGDDMELTISGDNIAEDATYIWKQGETILQDQTTATLIINHCDVTHAGNYVCIVSNGTCSAEANYTVKIFHLFGLKDESWTQPYVFMRDETANTAILYVDLEATTTYEFKIKNGQEWYWNEGKMMNDNCSNWTMVQEGVDVHGNTQIETTMAGTYAFKLDYSDAANLKLTVIYPSKQMIYLDPGVWDKEGAFFVAHAWTDGVGNDKDIQMTRVNDCTDRIIYQAEIEGAHNRIIFVRCNPSNFQLSNIWTNEWNRTCTQWLTSLPGYQFNISEWGGETEDDKECSSGSWSEFIPYYTVSYNMNGHGEGIGDACIQNSYSWTAPPDPIAAGYTFLGWRRPAATGDNKLYKYDQGYKPTASEELTAQWQINQCTITWKVAATGVATTVVDIHNPLSTIPYSPADNELGCCAEKFIGWSTETNPSKNQVYTTAADLQNLIGTLTANTTKTFHAVFATPVPGAGNSLVTFSEMGYANEEAVASVAIGDGMGNGDASITFAKGSSSYAPAYYNIGEAVRAYAGNTITVAATYTNTALTQIDLTFAKGEGNNTITASTGTIADGVWTGDAQSVTFTIDGTTDHRRIAAIAVTTEVVGDKYTNYVTKCELSGSATIGAGTITYANSATAIETKCGQRSPASKAATLTFASAQDLTCPVTIEATTGFLVSTNRNDNSKYASSIIVKPVKSGTNKGKLPTIYVRYEANFGVTGQIHGTITATGSEIDNTDVAVLANVTCTQYTLTVVDHLGNTISTTNYYEGNEVAEIAQPTPDDCSTNYTFDGWSTEEVAYGSLIYNKVSFPYTMPATDVTLYPVYRLVEDVSEADYHRVTSDLGADNWAGDYLIANAPTTFVDGTTSALNVADMSGEGIIVNEVISAYYGDPIHVSLIAVEGGYVLKTQENKNNDKPYVYITSGGITTITTANQTTADDHPLTIRYSEPNVLIENTANTKGYSFQYHTSSKVFGFYKAGSKIYLYKKSPLYTTSLICEEVTASDALVTSTAGQTVKVNVMATMDNMTIARQRELTVESDHNDFAATITKTSETTYNVAVSYTPAAEQIIDGTDVANITIKVNNIPVNTFQVTGRHLPPNFVIAAKWDGHWYALPANCTSSLSSTEGLLIEVDDVDNPTRATHAPASAKYGIREVIPSRQTDHGQGVVFTERYSNDNKEYSLYNNGTSANLQVYSQYSNYAATNPERYEWTPSTTDFVEYTLTNANSSRKITLNNSGVFSATTASGQVRLLPATFYEPAPVQVLKWKENSVIVMYTGAEATATTQVGNNDASDKQTLADQKITHGIYELTTNQALISNAGGVLKLDFGANTRVELEIPLIISGDVTASANAHDVVILENSKLTAAATKYSYKDVYVYGGAKLAIPTGTTLGVNNIILRAGSVATDGAGQNATYQYIYPQVELKGTLTSSVQNIRYEYVTDYDHWYHLALPFDGSLASIHYPYEYYGDQVKLDNTGSWQIKRYAGEIRATGNYDAWKDIEEDDPKAKTVTAGKGYIYWGAPKKITANDVYDRPTWGIQRITMSVSAPAAKTAENGDKTIVGLSSHKDVPDNSKKVNDQGWNLIGNPYMVNLTGLNSESLKPGKLVEVEDAAGNWTGQWKDNEDGFRYVTIPSDHFETYTAQRMTAFTEANPMIAGRAFFIQLEDDDAGVTFSAANRASLMPQHLAAQNTEVEIETGIILSSETMQDEMNFWIKDGKTNDYEYNADYPKTPNNTNFNIYGVHINGSLSWVATGPEYAEESMPIGYQVPAAGTYTLSISETYYSDILDALYVTDHAMSPELTVDLMNAPYEFSVNQAETNNERFTVSVRLKSENQGPTTGLENTGVQRDGVIKFIYQDKIFILHNGVIYDATGKQIITINK